MLEQIVIISLIITAIYISMADGMLLHPVRRFICRVCDYLHCSTLRKPLCECVVCMGGIYTLAIYPLLYGLSWQVLPVMLGVIGLNTLISALTCHLHE